MHIHRVLELLLESFNLCLTLKQFSLELIDLTLEIGNAADLSLCFDMFGLKPTYPIFQQRYVKNALLVLYLSLGQRRLLDLDLLVEAS